MATMQNGLVAGKDGTRMAVRKYYTLPLTRMLRGDVAGQKGVLARLLVSFHRRARASRGRGYEAARPSKR